MDYTDPQFKENVQLVVRDYFKSGAFKDRKLTDTPTDDLQVVNKKYSDRNKITYSSVAGEYLNGNAQFKLPQYITGTAGEDLLANDAVFVSNFTGDNTILDTAATGADTVFGNAANSNVRIAQTFSFPTSTQLISKITFRLLKTGTPTDNVVVTLRDNLDGTIIQTIATIAGGTITGSYADYSYTLTEIICAKNTSYVIQMARDGGIDAVNYYRWQTSTGPSYPNGFGANFDGTTWATNQADRQLIIKMTTTASNIYKCRTDISGFYEMCNGFVKTGVSKNATVTINVGTQQTLSGMTGRFQYLTDSPGLISQTPGTANRKIGVAFSQTALQAQLLGELTSFGVSPSTNLRQSADTERDPANGSVPTKIKSIVINVPGYITVKFDMKVGTATQSNGRIYRNGVAVGTLQSASSASYVTYSENIQVYVGDAIQLYGWTGVNGGTIFFRNFRIYYDKQTLVETSVITD